IMKMMLPSLSYQERVPEGRVRFSSDFLILGGRKCLVKPAGAGVMQLVVRFGEGRDGDAMATVLGMDKAVIAGVNADMRDAPAVGILEEHEVAGPQGVELNSFTHLIESAAVVRQLLQTQI